MRREKSIHILLISIAEYLNVEYGSAVISKQIFTHRVVGKTDSEK